MKALVFIWVMWVFVLPLVSGLALGALFFAGYGVWYVYTRIATALRPERKS